MTPHAAKSDLSVFWRFSDSLSCPNTKQSAGLVESIYREISNSVPHSDRFYPSCSRFIMAAYEDYSLLGLIVGLGRFSRAHFPPVQSDYDSVIVRGEIRILDTMESMKNVPKNSGYSSYPAFFTDCDESSVVHSPFLNDRGPDPSWRL